MYRTHFSGTTIVELGEVACVVCRPLRSSLTLRRYYIYIYLGRFCYGSQPAVCVCLVNSGLPLECVNIVPEPIWSKIPC